MLRRLWTEAAGRLEQEKRKKSLITDGSTVMLTSHHCGSARSRPERQRCCARHPMYPSAEARFTSQRSQALDCMEIYPFPDRLILPPLSLPGTHSFSAHCHFTDQKSDPYFVVVLVLRISSANSLPCVLILHKRSGPHLTFIRS